MISFKIDISYEELSQKYLVRTVRSLPSVSTFQLHQNKRLSFNLYMEKKNMCRHCFLFVMLGDYKSGHFINEFA